MQPSCFAYLESLTSVSNLRQKSSDEKPKNRFSPVLRQACALWTVPYLKMYAWTAGNLISTSTRAASWVENIQEVSSSISTLFKLKCFLFFFCCCFSVGFPVDWGGLFFFFLSEPDDREIELLTGSPSFELSCELPLREELTFKNFTGIYTRYLLDIY